MLHLGSLGILSPLSRARDVAQFPADALLLDLAGRIVRMAPIPTAALFLALLPLSANGQAITTIYADGWTFDVKKIERNVTLPATATVQSAAGGVLILACGENVWLEYECSSACTVPACARSVSGVTVRNVHPYAQSPRANKGSRSLLELLFMREPKPPEVLAARAGGNPADAVLLQDARGTHWAPALNRVLEGHYCFRLSSLPPGKTARVLTFNLDWDRTVESEGLARVPNLNPGLYSLEKGTPGADQACRLDREGVAAWVLIVQQSAFSRFGAEWKETAARAAELQRTGASPSAVITMRHAALAGMADTLEPQ